MKKRLKVILISVVLLLMVLVGGFLVYASDYYRADETANAILHSDTIQAKDNLIILPPEKEYDTALIFYPGAKVEYTAYLPILEKLRQNGIACVLIKMPFNMAIFSVNAADVAFKELSGISNWFIGGHSMGGAMASSYFARAQKQVERSGIAWRLYLWRCSPGKRAHDLWDAEFGFGKAYQLYGECRDYKRR